MYNKNWYYFQNFVFHLRWLIHTFKQILKEGILLLERNGWQILFWEFKDRNWCIFGWSVLQVVQYMQQGKLDSFLFVLWLLIYLALPQWRHWILALLYQISYHKVELIWVPRQQLVRGKEKANECAPWKPFFDNLHVTTSWFLSLLWPLK